MKKQVRLRKAQRQQVEMMSAALDDVLPHDHFVRLVWKHIDRMDLSAFHESIRAVDGKQGRDATDPKILLCLWVVALSEGVGSARRLEALTTRDLVYRWVCGGVSVNRDLLASFRSARKRELDLLLTQNLAALVKAGVLTLNTVAQDGMRVRASAGAASFRREPTLKECLRAAEQQLKHLEAELREDGNPATKRDAARIRAAEEKLKAIERALQEMPVVEAARAQQSHKPDPKKSPPRVSTTDPEARVMKMADGGFRPAHNTQFATDVDSGVIVGVDVSNHGTDAREAEPVIADVLNRLGKVPGQYLVDGGYSSHDNIESLTALGTEVFAPVPDSRNPDINPYEPKPTDSPAVVSWRRRMASWRGKSTYRLRASTAERANAELRTKGLRQLTVRGLSKVTSAVLLSALAFNLCRTVTLLG